MMKLHRGILAGLDGRHPGVVQFTGAAQGVGTTRTLFTLAEVMARRGVGIASANLCAARTEDVEALRTGVRDETPAQGSEVILPRGTSASRSIEMFLLDTAPIAVSPVSMEVAAVVAGTVLVVEADRTPDKDIRRALELIEAGGGHCLGLVLNRRPRRWRPGKRLGN